MAIMRAKQKAQVIQKLAAVAPPGDQFRAVIHSETGPSPWLNILFDRIPVVGLVVALNRKYFFLTLTNHAVVVNTCSRFRSQPGHVVATYPLSQVPISKAVRGKIWSALWLQMPHDPKPVRLNVHRYWRGELDQFFASLPPQQLAAVEVPDAA